MFTQRILSSKSKIFAVLMTVFLLAMLGCQITPPPEQISPVTVTYHANGADAGSVPPAQTADSATEIVISANSGNLAKTRIANTGFGAWNSQPDGSGAWYHIGDAVTFQADTDLYAQWNVISAGINHTLVVKDGALWVFGNNDYGQLGDGTTISRSRPHRLIDSGVTSAVAGGTHSLVLMQDGSLLAMGRNDRGQLGDGSNTDRHSPVEIMSSGVSAIQAGEAHSLLVLSDGSLSAMGFNVFGRLGDGTTTNRNLPTQIYGAGLVDQVGAGARHSMFLLNDGGLYASGRNNYGQLGDGTTTDRLSPVQVGPFSSPVSAISASSIFTHILLEDGSVWGSGSNGQGALGISGEPQVFSQVLGSDIIAVSSTDFNTMFLKSDSSLLATGYGSDGALGRGSTVSTPTPVEVVSDGVAAISSGSNYALILKQDGSIWGTGENQSGQLGDGTQTNSLVYKRIQF